ncbi:SDR family oxidoreductase [Spirosoma flavum]|uniref:SDR family oxidoreductase n=1 Tax=Spirosoma flavum TaxID=2048557 RepID=A0ABW6AKU6_9BACT
MKTILVIGASGFIGGHLTRQLLAEGYVVRCLARKPAKMNPLAQAGAQLVPGDITDPASLQAALAGVDAVYISIQTLVPQHSRTQGQDFMAIELNGLQNIVDACQFNQVHRLIYVTFLGTHPQAASAWARERWQAEQLLLNSSLAVTVIRPGMIVGVGGQGFDMLASNGGRRLAIVIGRGQQRFRCIAIDDLIYYLVGVLADSRTYGQAYDVGSNDVLTMNQLIDVAADVLGRPHPAKLHIPTVLLSVAAPLIEWISKASKGGIQGALDGMKSDMIGQPEPIRAILPRVLLTNRQAVERALHPN